MIGLFVLTPLEIIAGLIGGVLVLSGLAHR